MWLPIVVMFLVAVPPAFADDGAKLVGTWKLLSREREVKATGEKEALLGKNPSGYMIFTPERRFMVILTGEGRQTPKTDKDRADLMNSMFALTGKYRVEGDKYFVKVDASWNPQWLGTDQERFFKIDGDRLHIQTQWLESPNWPGKGLCRGLFTLERAN